MKSNQQNSGSFLCSWSGGKDSYFAFYRAVQQGYKPKVLLNTLNEYGDKSRSHGIPRGVLEQQAKAVGLPIEFIETTWETYEERYIAKLKELREKYAFTHAVFGDIDIESHRAWEEKVANAANVKAVLPLWQGDRKELVEGMITAGIKTMIVSCRKELADSLLGEVIDGSLIKKFEELGIDACGENGEYHTFVLDGPLNGTTIAVDTGSVKTHNTYAFLDLHRTTFQT
ncbi:diphthine--ammonia ligase [Roseivirga pacifica]|uniref:Dph6-related ATP pyrophosphatase n=1 Tax=Roseivirga pacifica TaxID=1267423 RepID=UPI0020963D8C|nr:diphthine--ammonia ligase [Roseivirga pacifica]MCO6359558.1 diphthine--ammonia ligase [Roseivirga pacifica]MCO6366928.1 diphthine--ammonia ligase [Roseivirga pacifica]MCO6370540.1 diphthine--ammonia ligase [Roseivirga pacifica]MCO6374585.1 diphthine--ammonia ligase [Roseivirga pacifica]MCO6379843.1 diphthine--ammonia ligase [Roseivirga pacifica]